MQKSVFYLDSVVVVVVFSSQKTYKLSTNGTERKRMSQIVIKSEEKRLVYGEVYAPMQLDTDGEAMTADAVEQMAFDFMLNGRTTKIDVGHNYKESGCYAVESFIARKNDPDDFLEGAWVLGVKIAPDDLWEAVKKGEINGFSFAGKAEKVPTTVKATITKQLEGLTEKSDVDILPPHEHSITIKFDEESNVIPTETGYDLEHSHPVLRTTATELEMDHAHRMILIEND